MNDPGLSSRGALTLVSGENTAWQLGTVMVSTSSDSPMIRLNIVAMTAYKKNDVLARAVPMQPRGVRPLGNRIILQDERHAPARSAFASP